MSHPQNPSGHTLCEFALAACPGEAAVIVTLTERLDLRFARSAITTNGNTATWELTLVAMPSVEGGIGVASATTTNLWTSPNGSPIQIDQASVTDLARRAFAAAQQSPPAADAAALLTADTYLSSTDGWSDQSVLDGETLSATSLGPIMEQLAEMFDRGRHDSVGLFGYAEQESHTTWVATTAGRQRRSVQRNARFEVTARHDTEPRSTWWGRSADRFEDIDLTPAYSELSAGLAAQRIRRPLAPGRHPVLLTPSAVGDLMVELWWSASAADAVDGRSVFSSDNGATRIGERLAPATLSLISDPHHPLVPASDVLAVAGSDPHASVFDNGALIPATPWIGSGILRNLMCGRAYAERHTMAFTPSADSLAMHIDGAEGGLHDLISRTEHAILITCLWYNRMVDPQRLLLTGLTRDGVYEVRHGQIIGAVDNFRFLDSPVEMLNRITDSSATARTLPREMGDYAPRVAMPALAVDGFDLNSRSDAM